MFKLYSSLIFLFSFLLIPQMTVSDDLSSNESTRAERFFPFFIGPKMVRFPNTPCVGDSGWSGTCYTRQECGNLGGKASGTCAKGFGCCCIIEKTCGGSIWKNCTYFVSPSYPGNYLGNGSICTITIWKTSNDVCQLRLDFKTFELAPPDPNGNCLDDFFIVSGGASNVPRICGTNTGQHVYVDFNGNAPITITIDTNTAVTINRRWKIKVTQVKCCDRAPIGCLMDYKATSGKVMSFNYGTTQGTTTDPALPGTREIANLNYGVCIEMAPGYCSIEWSQNPNDPYSFTVSGDTDILDNTLLGNPIASVRGENCTGDYIIIPNPMENGMILDSDRFCGNALPTVTSQTKPFVLTVVTNSQMDNPPNVGNRGFCINYRQLPCA